MVTNLLHDRAFYQRRWRTILGSSTPMHTAGSFGGSPAGSRIESGRAASGGSSPSRSRRPLRHGRSVPAVAVQPPLPRPSRCRTTVEGVVQWSVRFAPSNVSTGSGTQVLSFRWTIRKSASFRTGYPRLAAALSVPLQTAFAFSGIFYPLHHPRSLRSAYRREAGCVGLTLLPDGELDQRRLRPMARWGSSPSPPTQEFGGSTHAPFSSSLTAP